MIRETTIRTATVVIALTAATGLAGCTRDSTQAAVENSTVPVIRFVNSWGVKGSDPGQLDQPASIATDVEGNVYITDAGTQYIEKFQADGTPLLAFQDDHLKHPRSVAVDRGGAIYVTDPVRGSVFIYLPDGSRYREIRLQSRPNDENTLDVTVADDGSMSVLDVNAAKVFDFNPRLHFQRSWIPSVGGPDRPREIEAGPADAIYVAGSINSPILRYDDGKLTSQIPLEPQQPRKADNSDPPGYPPAQNSDVQFAVSQRGIFESDPSGRSIYVWSLDGTPKAVIDLPANQIGEHLRTAPPIAVSPAGDLFVLLPDQCKVLHFRVNL